MTRKVSRDVHSFCKPVNRLHVAFGSKLVISAEGFIGIAAVVVLVVGFAFVVGGLGWKVPLPR